MPVTIDKIDRNILEKIQEDAKMSVISLGETVGVSASPCWRRIKRMEEIGVIGKRVACLSGEKLGLDFVALVEVKLVNHDQLSIDKFERNITTMPEVQQCSAITGDLDYMLRIVTTDMQAFDLFLSAKLQANPLICDVKSRIVVRQTKNTMALPLSLL